MANRRIINHADVELIATEIEKMAGKAPGENEGGNHILPTHDDGVRLKEALQDLSENRQAGHTIIDESGRSYPQRKRLEVTGAEIEDDQTSNTTRITVQGGGNFSVTVTASGYAGEPVTLTNGTTTQTKTLSSLGIANFIVTEPGTYTASAGGAEIGSVEVGQYAIEQDEVFGFIEHMAILAPGERIEYIGANANYNPIQVTMGGGYDLGDWKNYRWLKKNKPCMVKKDGTVDYELDPENYTRKKNGGTSDVANDSYSGAGAFSWAERIYKKETISGTDRQVEFCFTPRESFEPVGFIGKNGEVLEGRWIPMFYSSLKDGEAKTLAGVAPQGRQTTDAQITAVQAVGSRANFLGGPFLETLIDLEIMFSKTSDVPDRFGYGACNGYSTWNASVPAQTVVSGGQFYGTNDKKSYNKIFHSVVLGSYMIYCRDPYEILVNGRLMVSTDYHIDLTGATYVDTGLTYSSTSGWQYPDKYAKVSGYGSVPVQPYGGSTTTGGCDGLTVNASGTRVGLRFGHCNNDLAAGPRARHWNNAASSSNWHIGFAVLLDPPVGVAA